MRRLPAVFVSSTCYDLQQVRTNIRSFVEEIGMEPLLSEYDSFPVDPAAGTVENCLKTVEQRADVFILIIGGRYGFDKTPSGKSITNLEYLRAKAKGIPIFVFVHKPVLSYLEVWKLNSDGNYKGIVDTTKLFEFVSSLRDSGGTWVYPFESAHDITTTLKKQLAYLVTDGLEVLRRVNAPGLPPTLRQLNGSALRLVIEKPFGWEGLLFVQVLKDEMQGVADFKRDNSYGVSLGVGEVIADVDLVGWALREMRHVMHLIRGLERFVNTAIREAMSPPSNPENVVYGAKRLAAGYRELLEAASRCRRAVIEPRFSKLVDLIASIGSHVATEVEVFVETLGRDIQAVVANPPEEESTAEVRATLTFTAPDLEPLQGEIEKVRAVLQARAAGQDDCRDADDFHQE
jgi:hypothetical protein